MSPCCDCITSKKENKKDTEQKHSKSNGNLNRNKKKGTEANPSHPDSTAVASRPRITTGKNIRTNRPNFNNQCSDPECPFNRTRVRQTMPSGGTRVRAPRRTQNHRDEGGGDSKLRRVKRTQSHLPPRPDFKPPRPPQTPLPPFPRQKSFIHDKYVSTEDSVFYSPSPSPEPEQYRHQNTLPVPQAESRSIDSRRPSAAEEVALKVLRRLRPLHRKVRKADSIEILDVETNQKYNLNSANSASKDSSNSENLKDQYDGYTSSYGSSHGDLASNTTHGYIPPPPPMPAHLLSYRNVLKPPKNTILPEKGPKHLQVVDIDSSKKTNFTSKLEQFKRFHRKVRKADSIEILDVQTNQKYNLNSVKPRRNKDDRKDISIVKI